MQTNTIIRARESGRCQADPAPVTTPVLVVRIPKSASTTLGALARQAFPGTRYFHVPNTLDLDGQLSAWQRLRHCRHAVRHNLSHHGVLKQRQAFDRISETIKPGDLLIGGHADYDTCRKALGPALKFLTVIRNPTTRVMSEYAYARTGHARKPWNAKFDASLVAKAAARFNFEDYLRFLCERRAIYGDIACRHIGLCPSADIAPHIAAHAFHIGTVDNLKLFADGLGRKTGNKVAITHLNPTISQIDRLPTPHERTLIERLYARDVELYEWCLERDAQRTRRLTAKP